MNCFICDNRHDEEILLEILSEFANENRPKIIVKRFREKVHDIQGTLNEIEKANLFSMHKVLSIDDVNVECLLIDEKHVEATILVENISKSKEIYQSGILQWSKIQKKIRNVVEAWTLDGSNVKFDPVFRIYSGENCSNRFLSSNRPFNETREQIREKIGEIQRNIGQKKQNLSNLNAQRRNLNDLMKKSRNEQLNIEKDLRQLNEVRFHSFQKRKSLDRFSLRVFAAKRNSRNEEKCEFRRIDGRNEKSTGEMPRRTSNSDRTLRRVHGEKSSIVKRKSSCRTVVQKYFGENRF